MSPTIERLEKDGLIERDGDALRTTRKWQGAMARAALRLYAKGDSGEDLRVPIALAMVDAYGRDFPDEELVTLIEAMLPIEEKSLGIRAT